MARLFTIFSSFKFWALLFAALLATGFVFYFSERNGLSDVESSREYRFDYRKEAEEEAKKARLGDITPHRPRVKHILK